MSQDRKTYIIGDVHGEFDTLVKLTEKLPKNAELIFVGDLIDRGAKSKEVIEFVRKNNYRCVLGNHEQFMIDYGTSFTKTYPYSTNPSFLHSWYNNGGDATLFSYGLLRYDKKEGMQCVENFEAMTQFQDDIEWLKTLPLYIELDSEINNLPVVITHASCGDVWHHHDNPNAVETFRDYALWHRQPPKKDTPIYNIHGHTPVEFGVEIEENYTNVDTGCYIKKHGYNELSAFCVESGEVVSVSRVVN
jgi:serine/threonine protein phosphatase 1